MSSHRFWCFFWLKVSIFMHPRCFFWHGSCQALSKIACNRLQKELVEWQVNPPAGFKHKVTDNLQRCAPSFSTERLILYLPFCLNWKWLIWILWWWWWWWLFRCRWVIEVNGAPGTLYANELYQLQVDFPEHYPMEAPQVVKAVVDVLIVGVCEFSDELDCNSCLFCWQAVLVRFWY